MSDEFELKSLLDSSNPPRELEEVFAIDAILEEAVQSKACYSGMGTCSGIRDLGWYFLTFDAAVAAKKAIDDLKIAGLTCFILERVTHDKQKE